MEIYKSLLLKNNFERKETLAKSLPLNIEYEIGLPNNKKIESSEGSAVIKTKITSLKDDQLYFNCEIEIFVAYRIESDLLIKSEDERINKLALKSLPIILEIVNQNLKKAGMTELTEEDFKI